MECQFCKKKLSSSSSLKLHQITTKYCLKLQGNLTEGSFICKNCGNKCFTNDALKKHYNICSGNNLYINNIVNELRTIKKEILEYKEENNTLKLKLEKSEEEIIKLASDNINLERKIENYESKMFTLASKPTSVNNINNTTQNLIISDWRQDTITEKVERGFTMEHLEDGLKGVARFTEEHIIREPEGKKSFLCMV